MNRCLIILALLLIGTQVMFVSAQSEANIPSAIRNNNYYNESLRLTNLARLSYEQGDYDASTQYSEEAIRYAGLSDEYVRLRLKMFETDSAINAARRRLDYASSINAASRYPTEYSQAQVAYGEARSFRAVENWDEAIWAANRVLTYLANIGAGSVAVGNASESNTGSAAGSSTGTETTVASTTDTGGPIALPAQYTVRTWESVRDCLWNIAGRPWAYNDPWQWRRLYEANRSKMPKPDDPDLIEPGMVIDIPSIRGETRQGMWDQNATYSPLP